MSTLIQTARRRTLIRVMPASSSGLFSNNPTHLAPLISLPLRNGRAQPSVAILTRVPARYLFPSAFSLILRSFRTHPFHDSSFHDERSSLLISDCSPLYPGKTGGGEGGRDSRTLATTLSLCSGLNGEIRNLISLFTPTTLIHVTPSVVRGKLFSPAFRGSLCWRTFQWRRARYNLCKPNTLAERRKTLSLPIGISRTLNSAQN